MDEPELAGSSKDFGAVSEESSQRATDFGIGLVRSIRLTALEFIMFNFPLLPRPWFT